MRQLREVDLSVCVGDPWPRRHPTSNVVSTDMYSNVKTVRVVGMGLSDLTAGPNLGWRRVISLGIPTLSDNNTLSKKINRKKLSKPFEICPTS